MPSGHSWAGSHLTGNTELLHLSPCPPISPLCPFIVHSDELTGQITDIENSIVFMACNVHCRLLHQPSSSAWVAIAWFGVNQTALDKAGAFWRGKVALEAQWVGMADSSGIPFLICKTGQ